MIVHKTKIILRTGAVNAVSIVTCVENVIRCRCFTGVYCIGELEIIYSSNQHIF